MVIICLQESEMIFAIFLGMLAIEMLGKLVKPLDTRIARWIRKKAKLEHKVHDLKSHKYTNQFGEHVLYRCRDCKTPFTVQELSE